MDDPNLPPQWFARWADYHRTAFLLPDSWLEAAVCWWPVFAVMGATADEMYAATREVQASPTAPPGWGAHLPAVKAALGRVRDKVAQANAAIGPASERGVCTLCDDTAMVVVPVNLSDGRMLVPVGGEWLPARHNRGEPQYVEAVVNCSCYRGRRITDAQNASATLSRKRLCYTIEEYAKANPHWQEQVADKRARERALQEAVHSATARVEQAKRLAAKTPEDAMRTMAKELAGQTRIPA